MSVYIRLFNVLITENQHKLVYYMYNGVIFGQVSSSPQHLSRWNSVVSKFDAAAKFSPKYYYIW